MEAQNQVLEVKIDSQKAVVVLPQKEELIYSNKNNYCKVVKGELRIEHPVTFKPSTILVAVKIISKMIYREQNVSYNKEQLEKRKKQLIADLYVAQQLEKIEKSGRIIKMYGATEDDSNIYYVMELCQEGNLEKYFAAKQIRHIDGRLPYLVEVIQLLQYIYDKTQLTHLDIKPQNILVSGDQIKLIDFATSSIDVVRNEVSEVNTYRGTPSYMSPEMYASKVHEKQKQDVWQVGILLYYFSYDKLPFVTKDLYDFVEKQAPLQPKLLDEYMWAKTKGASMPFINPFIKDLITCMLNPIEKMRPLWNDVIQHPVIQNSYRILAWLDAVFECYMQLKSLKEQTEKDTCKAILAQLQIQVEWQNFLQNNMMRILRQIRRENLLDYLKNTVKFSLNERTNFKNQINSDTYKPFFEVEQLSLNRYKILEEESKACTLATYLELHLDENNVAFIKNILKGDLFKQLQLSSISQQKLREQQIFLWLVTETNMMAASNFLISNKLNVFRKLSEQTQIDMLQSILTHGQLGL